MLAMIPATRVIAVDVLWDDEAKAWSASTHDIRGFVCEAATMDDLRRKTRLVIADLAETLSIDIDGVELEYAFRVREPLAATA